MTSIDVTPGVLAESNPDRVAAMTGESPDWVAGMLIDRRGEHHDSNMTAIGLHRVARSSEVYRVSAERGLELIEGIAEAIALESLVAAARNDDAPPHTMISARWGQPNASLDDSENVLGDSVLFQVDGDVTEIEIPVLDATSEGMGYYGAVLVDEGALVRFPGPDYPIWKMELGETYVDGMLLSDQGTGFYLEYHHDRPHWHQPLTSDSGGYYILARQASAEPDRYQLSAFRIPFGKAVYTGLGTTHCDAALTGRNWLVGYSDSGDFSTALVRNRAGASIRLSGTAG